MNVLRSLHVCVICVLRVCLQVKVYREKGLCEIIERGTLSPVFPSILINYHICYNKIIDSDLLNLS